MELKYEKGRGCILLNPPDYARDPRFRVKIMMQS